MKFVPLNFEILRQPLNWIIVVLMVFIALIAMDEIFRFLSPNDPSSCGCKHGREKIPADSIPTNSES
jgi:hypothetical protein